MGRAGVTLLDIEKAALQLQGRGKVPTVDGIREILGTGSKSTIAQHLRVWKTQQTDSSSNLPHDLLALVTGLWERLNAQAEQRISEVENTAQHHIKDLKDTLTSLQQNYNQLEKTSQQYEELLATERTEKAHLEKHISTSEQEYAKLNERYQATVKQLEDYKDENQRLHKLANHIQANLEHYQHAMQQFRTEQTLAMEKQQLAFQQDLAHLQQELLLSRKQSQEGEHQLQQKTIEWQRLTKECGLLQQSHDGLTLQAQTKDRELAVLQERHEIYAKTLQKYEDELSSKNNQIVEMGQRIAVLADTQNNFHKSLQESENKIENLRNEKIFLVQEKAELQGHLNQMKSMTHFTSSSSKAI